ncbi:recombination regulator RecX [Acrocarpospora phusangensis]|nr:recombination regulator RecX [Acrocarpospora phusangensis]
MDSDGETHAGGHAWEDADGSGRQVPRARGRSGRRSRQSAGDEGGQGAKSEDSADDWFSELAKPNDRSSPSGLFSDADWSSGPGWAPEPGEGDGSRERGQAEGRRRSGRARFGSGEESRQERSGRRARSSGMNRRGDGGARASGWGGRGGARGSGSGGDREGLGLGSDGLGDDRAHASGWDEHGDSHVHGSGRDEYGDSHVHGSGRDEYGDSHARGSGRDGHGDSHAQGSGWDEGRGGRGRDSGAGGREGGRGSGRDGQGDGPEARARAVCLRLLTMAPRTRAQLAEALRKREIPDDVAEAVLERFSEVGLIDDEAFAAAWVSSRHAGRGLARRALAQELRHRGVSEDTVKDAVEQLDPDEEVETARRLVARKLPGTRNAEPQARTRRLVGMLARKGYSPALAFRVVREALEQESLAYPDSDEDDFIPPQTDDLIPPEAYDD